MAEYLVAQSEAAYDAAAALFREYAAGLEIDLGFQHFSDELNNLKVMYAPPFGCIILCKIDDAFAGCIAIRKIDPHTAELKRMYVKATYRHKKIGSGLLELALAEAKQMGYRKIRLDTLDSMTAAINLYKQYGFYEIPAYYFNPETNAVYFEKLLD